MSIDVEVPSSESVDQLCWMYETEFIANLLVARLPRIVSCFV
jgi:hypothetical protein